MLYYNDRLRYLLLGRIKQVTFDGDFVHHRNRKTRPERWIAHDKNTIIYGNNAILETVLGHNINKSTFIKDYYKNLF